MPVRLALVALVLAWPLALFGGAIATGHVLAPGDGLGYYLPVRAIAAEAWRLGELPFWNPFHFAGMPLLAAIQTGAFFPGNLPFVLLPPGAAMNLAALLAYMAAGAFTYLYARAIALPPAAAALAGLAFAGSGYMVAHLEHLTMIQAASLVPALFWAVERLASSGRLRYALAFAGLLALQLLAGYPQTTVVSGLMLAPYALWRGVAIGLPALRFGPTVQYWGWLGLGALVGVGLTALQLLPTQELLAASPRGRVPYGELIDHALPLRELATLLFPFMYGGVPGELFQVPPWGKGPWRNELMGYAGIMTLMLAALGLVAMLRSGFARYWALVAAAATLLALGGQTPLYELWAALPVLSLMRVPGRHLLELDFALAVLAGLGLSWLLAARADDRPRAAGLAAALVLVPMALVVAGLAVGREALAARWQAYVPPGFDLLGALAPTQPNFWVPVVVGVTSAAALVWLARAPKPSRQALLLLVLMADLLVFGWHQGWRKLVPPPGYALGRPVLSDAPRTLALSFSGYPYLDPARTRALRYPQTGALFGAKLVNGYEPIVPAHYARVVGRMGMGGTVAEPRVLALGHHALDVLGMRTLRLDAALFAKPAWSDPIEAHPRWDRQPDEAGVVVFANYRALPRAWRPDRVLGRTTAVVVDDLRTEVAFDPRTTALVEGGVPKAPAWTPGEAWATTVSPNRIRVRTRGTGPGLVVVSEAFDPGWRAWLGDQELPVRRVDALVLGVEVPSGDRVLELRYRPPAWERGLRISGLALGALGLWALYALWRARRRRPGAEAWA